MTGILNNFPPSKHEILEKIVYLENIYAYLKQASKKHH